MNKLVVLSHAAISPPIMHSEMCEFLQYISVHEIVVMPSRF
jgi:hypothetical protein